MPERDHAVHGTRAGDITDDFTATFYADFTDGTDGSKPTADLHKLRYDSVTRRITDTTYQTSWNKTTTPWTPVVPAAASSVRGIANDVMPYNATTPLFTYYAYDNAAIPSPTVKLWPAGAGASRSPISGAWRESTSTRAADEPARNHPSRRGRARRDLRPRGGLPTTPDPHVRMTSHSHHCALSAGSPCSS